MDEDKAKEALAAVREVSGRLIQRVGCTQNDAIFVAVALMQAAEMIYLHIGGPKLAAAQFQDFADRISASTQ